MTTAHAARVRLAVEEMDVEALAGKKVRKQGTDQTGTDDTDLFHVAASPETDEMRWPASFRLSLECRWSCQW